MKCRRLTPPLQDIQSPSRPHALYLQQLRTSSILIVRRRLYRRFSIDLGRINRGWLWPGEHPIPDFRRNSSLRPNRAIHPQEPPPKAKQVP